MRARPICLTRGERRERSLPRVTCTEARGTVVASACVGLVWDAPGCWFVGGLGLAGTVQVCNIPNSMTILDDLLPVSVIMSERKLTGVFNFTNPDAISHNEILDLYKEVRVVHRSVRSALALGRVGCWKNPSQLTRAPPPLRTVLAPWLLLLSTAAH
jgi:hypothetical protein